jgi:F420-non-reducing hydrogenase iron-sulfur subunit
MRLQYPSDVRIIQVPCTGKVDIIHLLQAFEAGADGVFVAGCLEGDCHFMEGNLFAKKRVKRVKEILDKVGLGGGRIEMFNLSAGMGGRFAEIVTEMDERVQGLGPSPIRGKKGAAPRPTQEVTA